MTSWKPPREKGANDGYITNIAIINFQTKQNKVVLGGF